jgi:hypothetical protein
MSTALERYVLVSLFMIKMSANFDSRILKVLQPVPEIEQYVEDTIYSIPSNLTQSYLCDISISPSSTVSTLFRLLKLLDGGHKDEMPKVSV